MSAGKGSSLIDLIAQLIDPLIFFLQQTRVYHVVSFFYHVFGIALALGNIRKRNECSLTSKS